ncbi:hypothetical protein RUM43_003522 [Polyplax serrata]|uniref:Uncharacterized protein n=1 Tax=Polyplax serrata TaxID=468196 RepID=A0AAN8P075_POLSC
MRWKGEIEETFASNLRKIFLKALQSFDVPLVLCWNSFCRRKNPEEEEKKRWGAYVNESTKERIERKGPSKGKVVRLTSQVIKHYLILGTHHQPIRQLGLCEKGKNASKCKLEKIKSENKMKNQMRCGKDQNYVEHCLIFIIYKTETQGREHQLINRGSFDTAKDKSKTNFQIGQPQQDDPRVPLRPIDRPLFEIKVKGQVNVLAIVCFPRGL